MYCGNAIWPHNEEGLENLARYIIRASFSQERMTYIAADDSAALKKQLLIFFSLTPCKIKTKLHLAHVLHMCYFMLESYIST